MTQLFSGLHMAVLMVGLGLATAPAYAQEESTDGAAAADDASKDESMLEKLEDAFKESTTPTDEESDPIGTTEDIDRDLY
jgi:hypothetical protein